MSDWHATNPRARPLVTPASIKVKDKSEVVPEWSTWRKKWRWRCTRCDKIAYSTPELAERAASMISERQPMKAYFAKACGWWHVTRRRTRGRLMTMEEHHASLASA